MVSCYEQATRCTGGPQPGALALVARWTRDTRLPNYGIYNCRAVRGGTTRSLHSEGRAADLAANAHDPQQRAVMERFVAWLIAHANELGVQYIIWNRRSWHCSKGWRPYTGVSPHTDHAHVELRWSGAKHPSLMWLDDSTQPAGGFLMALNDDQQGEVYHLVTSTLPGINHETGQIKAAVRDEGRLTRVAIAEAAGKTVTLDADDRRALARDVITGITEAEWPKVSADLGDDDLRRIAEFVNDELHRRLEG